MRTSAGSSGFLTCRGARREGQRLKNVLRGCERPSLSKDDEGEDDDGADDEMCDEM